MAGRSGRQYSIRKKIILPTGWEAPAFITNTEPPTPAGRPVLTTNAISYHERPHVPLPELDEESVQGHIPPPPPPSPYMVWDEDDWDTKDWG